MAMGAGTLRIHFTSDDLARTRFAAEPNPFWEMAFSRARLDDPDPPVTLRSWLTRVRTDRARLEHGARVLATLSPVGPYFPDFLTPPEGRGGLDAGMEAILGTPRRRLANEMGRLAEWSPVPPWARALTSGEIPAMTALTRTLRSYHDIAIKPYAEEIRARVAAEHADRSADPDTLLAEMAPLMWWRPPVLEMRYGVTRDLYLHGRGLLLVPSFFCRGTPVALADPDLPPTLVYPIDPRAHWQVSASQSLVALLGATRATVLTAIDAGTTTTELARRVRTSPASVSRHTQVLREARLIETTRFGTEVRHTLTPLGIALLAGSPW